MKKVARTYLDCDDRGRETILIGEIYWEIFQALNGEVNPYEAEFCADHESENRFALR